MNREQHRWPEAGWVTNLKSSANSRSDFAPQLKLVDSVLVAITSNIVKRHGCPEGDGDVVARSGVAALVRHHRAHARMVVGQDDGWPAGQAPGVLL
jgi:hypothetical protein